MKHTLSTISALFIASILSVVAAQTFEKPDSDTWYRLTTRYNGDDDRAGRCIQYFDAESEHPSLLWSAQPAGPGEAGHDAQLWRFIPSQDNPERYKIVCKAAPEGYVNPTPTATNADARWEYVTTPDPAVDPYQFVLVTEPTMSGVDSDGVSYCAISSVPVMNNYYNLMNCGGPRQDYAINLWSDDYSEDANEWLFRLEKNIEDIVTAVDNLENAAGEGRRVYYDIYGRPAAPGAKGLLVSDGKIVFVK